MVKAVVKYDKKALSDLMRYNAVSTPWKWLVYAFITLVGLFAFLGSIGTDMQTLFMFFFFFVLFVVGLALFSYFLFPMIKLRNFSDANTVINRFTFEESQIAIASESKTNKGATVLPYNRFFRIRESKTAFYLFVNKSSALIITKSEIVEGDSNALRSFLNEKIPNRKVNKLKK